MEYLSNVEITYKPNYMKFGNISYLSNIEILGNILNKALKFNKERVKKPGSKKMRKVKKGKKVSLTM